MSVHSRAIPPAGSRYVVIAAAAAGVLFVSSCAPGPAPDTEAAASALTQLDNAWSHAAATRNADSVAAYYAADAVAYPPNDKAAVGQAAARMVWASAFADSTYDVSWKTVHARVSKSGELGFTSGTYEESYKGAGNTRVTTNGKYVCVWAKQANGSWKAVHDIWNPDTK